VARAFGLAELAGAETYLKRRFIDKEYDPTARKGTINSCNGLTV
jgi:hypothetical protein